jgi:glycosyltransferase involved in cell wall biosynthesis
VIDRQVGVKIISEQELNISSCKSQPTSNVTVSRSRSQISVIIPVHNQEKNISTSLRNIKKVLESTSLSYEILVINDGSFDNTLKVLRKQERSDPRIRIISYPSNKGKGYAIKTGVLQSFGKIIIFIDGDLDISPGVIKDYIKELKTCDLVIASKRHPLSRIKAPLSRKILSRMFNLFVQVAVNIKIKDTQAGLKAGNGDILRMIFKVILVKRYAFDVELLAIATDLMLNIKEMPIEMNLDNRFRVCDIAKMFLDLAAISYRYRIKRWYQKQLELEIPN